jgi:hypothetical protein
VCASGVGCGGLVGKRRVLFEKQHVVSQSCDRIAYVAPTPNQIFKQGHLPQVTNLRIGPGLQCSDLGQTGGQVLPIAVSRNCHLVFFVRLISSNSQVCHRTPLSFTLIRFLWQSPSMCASPFFYVCHMPYNHCLFVVFTFLNFHSTLHVFPSFQSFLLSDEVRCVDTKGIKDGRCRSFRGPV